MLLETRALLLSFADPLMFVSLEGDAELGFVFSLLLVDVVTVEFEDEKDGGDAVDKGGGRVFGRTGYL